MNSRVLLAITGVLAAAGWVVAQQTPPQKTPTPQDEPTRFSLEVTRVPMLFSVLDRKGRFVTDLTRDDFDVLENKRPQVIQEFAAESNLPLRLAILIDTSNSIRDRFRFEQDAAVDFLRSAMRTKADKAMVVSFDSNAEIVSELTDSSFQLEKAIHSLHPGGGTALYDAILMASRDKLSKEQPQDKFRRAIVIVSDGDDNQSEFTRDQALEEAIKGDVMIFAISTNNLSKGDSEGDKVLKYMTGSTGGRAFFPFKVEDLASDFSVIAEELRHQYTILYRPEPLKTDGLFHQVEIRVKGHKELFVRARNGYYAPKM